MKKANKNPKTKPIDKGQQSLMDFISAEDQNITTRLAMENRLDEQSKIKNIEIDKIDNIKDNDELIRTEQIYIPYNKQISEFCKLSNNLYIEGNIKIRENFFENDKLKLEHWKKTGQKLRVQYIKYGQLDKIMQSDSKYYHKLGVCAQQTLINLMNNWSSYWESIKDWGKDKTKYLGKPRIPKKRKIDKEYVLTLTNKQCRIESGMDISSAWDNTNKTINWLIFPDWMNLKFKYPNGNNGQIKTRLTDKTNLREVRIIPKGVGYVIEIVYKISKQVTDKLKLPTERIIGIDFGKRNIVTIANNFGERPIAINGSVNHSINQFYNKSKGKLQRIYESQHLKPKVGTAKIIMDDKHNRRIKDVMHKYSRYIINYCIKNRAGTIIVGYNPEWKQYIKLGKKTNQNFVQMPHYNLYELITYKAKEADIQVIEQEESHTSKCSFLDNEPICHHNSYLGKRHGGLFTSFTGRKINADVQGAYNIIKKAVLRFTNKNDKDSIIRTNAILKVFPKGSADRIVGERLHPVRINPLLVTNKSVGMRDF